MKKSRTKAILLVAGLGTFGFIGALIVSYQAKMYRVTAGLFNTVECETGRMPENSEAFVRQAPRGMGPAARSIWEPLGARAEIVTGPEGRALRFQGTYGWPFTIEKPLPRDCGGSS